MVRRVAVIGAGSSGLVCIKVCLEEGLEPVCYESSGDIGGLWRFKESAEPERSGLYRSLVVNTSKEMMCYSDFPMPDHFPNYMLHSQLLQYLRLYAQHFLLLPHIRFQTTVTRVSQRPDFRETGQWDVETLREDGQEETQVFDAVLVCSGQYGHPSVPEVPGQRSFSGRSLHSWEYRDADGYRGKRVVVVGVGNSGGDIAVEISRYADKTWLSTRRGSWVVGRASSGGLPLDLTNMSRFQQLLMRLLPTALVNWAAERVANHNFDHALYGIKPKHRFLDGGVVVNDDLGGRLLQGALTLKPQLRAFTPSGVEFEDGTVEQEVDSVIFCTGYEARFPFLPQTVCEDVQHRLYKRVFPPSLERSTLGLMGIFRTNGPIIPVVEMQTRWTIRVMKGLCRLPSKEQMIRVMESDRKRNMNSFCSLHQAALLVDYIPYLDFMASQVGVRPRLLPLLLTDPRLWLQVLFGPCTPYQYRLQGPGSWTGARRAILTQWTRVAQPFRTGAAPDPGAPDPDPGRAGGLGSRWWIPALVAALILWKHQGNPLQVFHGSWFQQFLPLNPVQS